ncbi:hypothetical protein OZX69_09660 (plasmid) [Lactobacillus sp. ESL0731]|uniref:hypothetical protein n=1 Tax=unclassified Lactobacillus TaxID=2620435 RepID=UPI0023F9E8C0|nr:MULTISPECIES: hypothetical protein [unclassified Lactobacillus]WEV52091.1 hypothetical protein OZX63_09665 [Lactobacillus sp. ESL0700]WEV63218.1 hypothetical protein OZX69_09660 [Lactobacillus sp. ESL0731]
MNEEQRVNIISKIIFEALFVIFSVIYLRNLNNLNKDLRQQNLTSPFKVVEYKQGIAIKYFVGAVIVLAIALILIWRFYVATSKQDGDLKFVSLFLVSLVINLLISYFTVKFIYIPIFQSVLTVGFFGFGALVAMGSN